VPVWVKSGIDLENSLDTLQDWVANRIKAQKSVRLLNTCESGALVSGYTRSRTDVPASEAAIGCLHEATGRPVLPAAAEGKPAFEGYAGLVDALKTGDRDGNGFIKLSELVAYVQDQVPNIAARLNGVLHARISGKLHASAHEARTSPSCGACSNGCSVVPLAFPKPQRSRAAI
jgi:hypothetical protein